jgi:7-cyano-7-deazaguanine synthase
MKKAVVLLSGGLDSTTTLAIAQDQGFVVHALSVLYGQRNRVELLAAKRVAKSLGAAEHKIIELDLRLFGGSSLTDDISVKTHQEHSENDIPDTYVPARNTILLSLALAYAEVSGADDIFFGANIHDYAGYPDCRPDYVAAFEAMANLAVKSAVLGHKLKIHVPLVNMTKADIIKKGLALGVKYEDTHSCYDPVDDLACGSCSSCFYRKKGFLDAGVLDPTRYSRI